MTRGERLGGLERDFLAASAANERHELDASAGEDKTIRLSNVRTGRSDALLTGHTGPVESLAFQRRRSDAHLRQPGPDDPALGHACPRPATRDPRLGARLARAPARPSLSPSAPTAACSRLPGTATVRGGLDGRVIRPSRSGVSATTSGSPHGTLAMPTRCGPCSSAPTAAPSRPVAPSAISLWDVTSHERRGATMRADSIAFSPDGRTIATALGRTVSLRDAGTSSRSASRSRAILKQSPPWRSRRMATR